MFTLYTKRDARNELKPQDIPFIIRPQKAIKLVSVFYELHTKDDQQNFSRQHVPERKSGVNSQRNLKHYDSLYEEVKKNLELGWMIAVDTSKPWDYFNNPFSLDKNNSLIFNCFIDFNTAIFEHAVRDIYEYSLKNQLSRTRKVKPAKTLTGELTYNAEGNDIPSSIYYSRAIHWPGNSLSGVTLGRGYDMGSRSERDVYNDMIASGIPNEQAIKISKCAGLKGVSARDYARLHKSEIGEITLPQQKLLFSLIYPKYVKHAILNYKKWTTGVPKAKQWEELDDSIQEVLVDFVYQGFTKGPRPMLAGSNNDKKELIDYIKNTHSISQFEPGRHRADYLEKNK